MNAPICVRCQREINQNQYLLGKDGPWCKPCVDQREVEMREREMEVLAKKTNSEDDDHHSYMGFIWRRAAKKMGYSVPEKYDISEE